MGARANEATELAEIRSELRRLGYLDHRFERFLLQDALRARRPLRTVGVLTLKVGLLAGVALALVLAAALALANGNLATPLDLPVLFLHLFAPIAVLTGLSFLALSGVLLAVLRLRPVRHIESLALAVAVAAGAAALGLALWQGRDVLAQSRPAQLAALGLAAAAAAYLLVRLIYQGLLALAIRFTNLSPAGPLVPRRWLGFAVVAAIGLLAVPLVVPARAGAPPPPSVLPVAPGERVLLVGIDGVLPAEIDYLLATGDLPVMAGLERRGARLWSYRRGSEPPSSFWTTVATGLPDAEHGVTALDSFVPAGVRTPLARSGALRAYWSRIEVPLGLAEYRPVLATRRRAFTFWELAARGGRPVLAVNWWATFPATPVPGLLVAHGGFGLLAGGAAGVVVPEGARSELLAAMRRVAGEPFAPRLAAALPAAAAAALERRALLPDRFYAEVFASRMARTPPTPPTPPAPAAPAPWAAALYLPGLDIAAAGWEGGDVAFADLVRTRLAAADRLLGQATSGGDGPGTVAVVFDPGRRRSGRGGQDQGGRILFWHRAGCDAGAAEIAPAAVAAGLLRALGLPQSSELPPPPPCRWPAPPATVATYGRPQAALVPGAETRAEYLENLRSLGYL